MPKAERFTDPETSLSVFHGASPWWVRLCMRAMLMARLEDAALDTASGSPSGAHHAYAKPPAFSDLVWAWFEPSEAMRNAYLRHRLSQVTRLQKWAKSGRHAFKFCAGHSYSPAS